MEEPMASGIEMREAHFPGRAQIDAYGNGGFRFAGMSHRGSLLCLPSGIYGWNADAFAGIKPGAFDTLFRDADNVEVLLIGTGAELVPIPSELREAFRDRNIRADSMATGAAVRTFNVLVAENRAVAAALIAV
jgi:uncharacterized protein